MHQRKTKLSRFAEEKNLLAPFLLRDENRTTVKQRIRIAMGRIRTREQFPADGDGVVTYKGHAPTPGWSGRRWKRSALGALYKRCPHEK